MAAAYLGKKRLVVSFLKQIPENKKKIAENRLAKDSVFKNNFIVKNEMLFQSLLKADSAAILSIEANQKKFNNLFKNFVDSDQYYVKKDTRLTQLILLQLSTKKINYFMKDILKQ